MVQGIGRDILNLRNKIDLSQKNFGALIGTTAMNVSRYERDQHPVPGRTLLALGLLAKQAGLKGWLYWELAGLTRADARAALAPAQARAAAGSRR
jgi:transcriptional regulator with XRE-family HTH domain